MTLDPFVSTLAPEGPPAAEAARRRTVVYLFPGHVLTDHLANGDGLIAHGFISTLARRGHRIHVIAQRVDIRAALPANVTVHSLGAKTTETVRSRLHFLLRSRAIVRNLMRSEHIDVIHQLNPVNNGMSAGVFGLKIPLILGTFVAKWPEPQSSRQPGAMIRSAILAAVKQLINRVQESQAAAFLVTTQAALARFRSPSAVAGRVHWLAHGIDVAAFTPLAPASGSENTILYLTSVAWKKGIFTLLEAFELVRQALPQAKLVVAGHGPAFDEMRAYVNSMHSAAAIQVLGSVSRSDVPRLMANAAVYCLPSFGEPYATTVIEAMACAKPIVVSDSGGLPDMVDDLGGKQVKTGDVDALANALISILKSPALQREMGEHNRRKAIAEYDWEKVTDRLEDIYETVIASCLQVQGSKGSHAVRKR